MTTEHILYIPTIFLLGFLMGKLTSGSTKTDHQPVPLPGQPSLRKMSIGGRFVIGSFVVFATVFIATHFFELSASSKAVSQSLGGLKLFDTKPSFSSNEVYSRISIFPDSGIQLYKRFTHTIDIIFPSSMFAFLILLGRFVTQQLTKHRTLIQIVHALPIVWFAADLLENGIIFYLLDELPVRHNFLANILGYVTVTKFSFLLLSILGPAVVAVLKKQLPAHAIQ